MTTDATRALIHIPLSEIVVSRLVALDWYDGPREGFIELTNPPSSWFFRAYAAHSSQDDLDDLLFLFAPLPDGVLDNVAGVLSALEGPRGPQWVPDWRFPGPAEQQAADQRISEIIASAGAPEVVIRSRSLDSIDAVWRVL
jgi:hypothetical protein